MNGDDIDSSEFSPDAWMHSWPDDDAPSKEWHQSMRQIQKQNDARFKAGRKRMRQIEDAVSALSEDVEQIKTTTSESNDAIREMSSALIGNEKMKAKGRLDLFEETLNEHAERTEELEKAVASIQAKVLKVGAILVAIGTVLSIFGPTILEKLWH